MSDKKQYRVKVTEKHVDYVWVTASSRKEAEDSAIANSSCEYDCVYDAEIINTLKLTEEGEQ